MRTIPNHGPVISNHALMRWLERSGAIDAGAMRGLLANSLARAYQAARSITTRDFLILADGLVYVVRQDTVVTVCDDDGRHTTRAWLLAGPDQDAG